MKLNCGPTAAERARLKREASRKRAFELMEWHKHFAWWPIRMGSYDCRWLEFVERRARYWTFSLEEFRKPELWCWEYRSLKC